MRGMACMEDCMAHFIKLTLQDGSPVDVNFDLVASKQPVELKFGISDPLPRLIQIIRQRAQEKDPRPDLTANIDDEYDSAAVFYKGDAVEIASPLSIKETLTGTFLIASLQDLQEQEEPESVTYKVIQTNEEIEIALRSGVNDLHQAGLAHLAVVQESVAAKGADYEREVLAIADRLIEENSNRRYGRFGRPNRFPSCDF